MKIISLNKKIVKKAYTDNDLNDLLNIPPYSPTDDYNTVKSKLLSIRLVLGRVIKTLNSFSSIYKSFLDGRYVSNDISMQLVNDLKNLDSIKQKAEDIRNTYVYGIKNNQSQLKLTNYYNNGNLLKVIENQIIYLSNAKFDEMQTRNILSMSKGENIHKRKSSGGVNLENMSKFLNSAVYSISNNTDKTLKIIREVLQNACDAVNKKNKIGGIVKIYTSETSNESMDLIVEDNGTGMDWQTLSEKFFRYFESGKADDPEATGGFGIAKALIQETPKEGWSLETNDIHSSKYNKNMYFADEENYQHPKLEGNSIGGLRLTLYDIPRVDNYSIQNLSSKYASSSTLKIFLNDEEIIPLFTIETLKKMDGDSAASTIANSIGENAQEKTMIQTGLESLLKDKMGSLNFSSNGFNTSIDFYLNKIKENEYRWGNFFIFLNGQYQFELFKNNTIQRFDVICSVKTNSRPGSDEYPVDPGRENSKEPYKSRVLEISSNLKEAITKIFEDELFKEGLDIELYNQDKGGINFDNDLSDSKMSRLEDALMSVETNKNTVVNVPFSSPSMPPQAPQAPQTPQETKQNAVQKIIDRVKEIEGKELDQSQKNIIDNAVSKIISEKENTDIRQLAKEIIEGFEAQYALIIQKKYISKDSLENKKHLTANLTVVWNNVLKIIGERVMKSGLKRSLKNKKIVSGVIYSKDCLALSIPPRKNRDSYLTLINPINSAAIIETEMYQNQILESDVKNAHDWMKDETPTNKFTNFIFHLATHEITHAMFPSAYGDLEGWHTNITTVEILCQSEYEKVREIVKENMQSLRKDMKQLITVIKKERAKNAKTASKKNVFNLKKNSKK